MDIPVPFFLGHPWNTQKKQDQKTPMFREFDRRFPLFSKCLSQLLSCQVCQCLDDPCKKVILQTPYTSIPYHPCGVFTDPWMVDFYGINVGKYTIPLDCLGMRYSWSLFWVQKQK